MSLMRFYYDPLTEFGRLLDDELATRFRSCVSVHTRRTSIQRVQDLFRPEIDVHESKDTNIMTATFELPGMKSDDITIDIHQNRLTVAGEASGSHSHEEGGYSIRERNYGKFSRTLQLPFATKPDDVKAKMENGVLSVTFPKTTPEQQAQRIVIQ